MTAGEKGFLLLSSHLGNPDRKPLTVPQLRTLGKRVRNGKRPVEDRDLDPGDLMELGYGRDMAERIVALLADEELLRHYLRRGERAGCVAISRLSGSYPGILRRRLMADAPGCLWAKGDLGLLDTPMVALVGSRELNERNRGFAEEVGYQAARQGYTLVSGNARGADRTAQNACLAAGGNVISVVADELCRQTPERRMLYLSEDGFNEAFSAQRALGRNRVIHALGEKTLVAQCSYKTGGTWDGTVKNLRFGWSPVCCFDDGSRAVSLLCQMGAEKVDKMQLADFRRIGLRERSLFAER